MIRNFLPFILTLLGLTMISFVYTRPLFEWQVSEIVADVPISYEVHVSPSPWKTWIGDALNDKAYVFTRLSIRSKDQYCSPKAFNIVVKRSRIDALIEWLLLVRIFNRHSNDWLIWWALIEIAISIVYLIWFTVWQKPLHFSYIVISWMFAFIVFFLIMIPTMKLMGPRVGIIFGGTANCQGTIIFDAQLAKVHNSVLIAWLAGVFAEVGALVMMMRQVVKAVSKSIESSKLSAV